MFNDHAEIAIIHRIDQNRIYRSDEDSGHVISGLGVFITLRAWNVPWSQASGGDIRRTLEEIEKGCKRWGGKRISLKWHRPRSDDS
jgi:hypothetical protein